MADAPTVGMRYPVDLDVTAPERFTRVQMLLRLALAIGIGFLGISLGWIFFALYLALPIIAAVVITQKGGDGFMRDSRPLQRALTWVIAFYGYMLMVTDRFPTGDPDPELRVEIDPMGTPSIGSALSRLLTSIPATLVLFVLALISGVVLLIAALAVLITERNPPALQGYQRGLLRWQARLLVYHASLVDVYPPFSFESEDHHPHAV